jgi:hypothetical protein
MILMVEHRVGEPSMKILDEAGVADFASRKAA